MPDAISLAIAIAFCFVYLALFERYVLNPRDRSARGPKAPHHQGKHHAQRNQPAQR